MSALVALRGPDGKYLGRGPEGEICWVEELSRAHKYYREQDSVDAQVREVKRRHGINWTIVTLTWNT